MVLVLIVLLYVGWRSGRLRQLSRAVRSQVTLPRSRRLLPGGVRIRPAALIPTLLLLAVVAWLVVSRN